MNVVDAAVSRVLRVKSLSVFEKTYWDVEAAVAANGGVMHRRGGRIAAIESIVLLKKRRGACCRFRKRAVPSSARCQKRGSRYSGPGIQVVDVDGISRVAGPKPSVCGRTRPQIANSTSFPRANLVGTGCQPLRGLAGE